MTKRTYVAGTTASLPQLRGLEYVDEAHCEVLGMSGGTVDVEIEITINKGDEYFGKLRLTAAFALSQFEWYDMAYVEGMEES